MARPTKHKEMPSDYEGKLVFLDNEIRCLEEDIIDKQLRIKCYMEQKEKLKKEHELSELYEAINNSGKTLSEWMSILSKKQ